MTATKRRKARRATSDNVVRTFPPAQALRMWGPSVDMWLEGAASEVEAGQCSTAMLIERLNALKDKLEGADVRGIPGKVTVGEYELRNIHTLALSLYRHFGELEQASDSAISLFGTIKRGGW